MHLLLDLLLLRHSLRSHHAFVLLEVVDELPFFVFGVIVDDVNPLALGGTGDAGDASGVPRCESGDG